MPRASRRSRPPGRSAGDRSRPSLRVAATLARRATGGAGSCRRRSRAHLPGTLGRTDPLDHHNPLRLALRSIAGEPRHPAPLPPTGGDPAPLGPHAVQVLRTYPAKRPSYSFAPVGERSVARAYLKAFRRARGLVYLEDQYLWSEAAARALAKTLSRRPELKVIVVVPRYPDRGGRATSAANRIGRERATKHPARRPARAASRCTTSRTRKGRPSTCTPRSVSSTTCC